MYNIQVCVMFVVAPDEPSQKYCIYIIMPSEHVSYNVWWMLYTPVCDETSGWPVFSPCKTSYMQAPWVTVLYNNGRGKIKRIW